MTNNKQQSKEKSDAISRIQNATRDTAMSFSAFRKADARLAEAVREGRKAGMTEAEIEVAITNASPGNPRVRQAIIDYSNYLMELRG